MLLHSDTPDSAPTVIRRRGRLRWRRGFEKNSEWFCLLRADDDLSKPVFTTCDGSPVDSPAFMPIAIRGPG